MTEGTKTTTAILILHAILFPLGLSQFAPGSPLEDAILISKGPLQGEKGIIEEGIFQPDQITSNPQLVQYNVIMGLLCHANILGNYQNPLNCTQFIMCAPDSIYLWQCPGNLVYDPVPDACVYPGENNKCPWHVIWEGPTDCATIGQRPWPQGSPITIPVDPKVKCGSEIEYCSNFTSRGTNVCPERYGYSKSYNGCLLDWVCDAFDTYFKF